MRKECRKFKRRNVIGNMQFRLKVKKSFRYPLNLIKGFRVTGLTENSEFGLKAQARKKYILKVDFPVFSIQADQKST